MSTATAKIRTTTAPPTIFHILVLTSQLLFISVADFVRNASPAIQAVDLDPVCIEEYGKGSEIAITWCVHDDVAVFVVGIELPSCFGDRERRVPHPVPYWNNSIIFEKSGAPLSRAGREGGV